jgi:hypothetical protein
MENTFHLPYFGLKNNLFQKEQVYKDLEDYIRSNIKLINSLDEFTQASIQKFLEAPTGEASSSHMEQSSREEDSNRQRGSTPKWEKMTFYLRNRTNMKGK